MLAQWVLALVTSASLAQARVIEGVNFNDHLDLGGTHLVLNGAGLRVKRKLGINWRVYVAGLYLPAISKDATAIIDSVQPAVIDMVFLRSVDKEKMQEAFREGFEKNCGTTCDQSRNAFAQFSSFLVEVKDKSRLKITFEKDGVVVEPGGRIASTEFRRILMAIFLGPQPPTEELKKGLLGLGS